MTHSRWQGKHVLVLGLAKSGTAAARILKQLGAKVIVNDQLAFDQNDAAKELQQEGFDVVCGEHPESLVHEGLYAVVKNPGIRYDHSLIKKALKLQIPVLTEVQIAYDIAPCDMIGITGSNGKTTTTTYIHDMLVGGAKTPHIAGNIGVVAAEVANQASESDIMVVELSSFQLMGTDTFAPKIAILLNLIDAHLDYHGTRDEYIEAKKQIFMNQTKSDYLIYNADDEIVCEMIKDAKATLVPFSTKKKVDGAYVEDGYLQFKGEKIVTVDSFSLPGEHNVSNALSALAAAFLAGGNIKTIQNVLQTFSGVEHRLQYVTTKKDRKFYNNSKATNVAATVTALQAFEQPIVLIAGGLDRGLSFDELEKELTNVHTLVSYGETSELLAEAATRAGAKAIVTETLSEAVPHAFRESNKGDVVLLSPACASWDQFKTFEERGKAFLDAVYHLDD
ncbi:UDP-N-acetylmuramoyl-L-alanine--D-glutamate ligase [Paenalkalicoccus suaedae]|nr:UDP-N-acetylmuramoyl-L-alanine--D-glutamate ligase [Paenalkalicoccus suaedae]